LSSLDFYAHEFWRFVFLQQKVEEFAQTFVDFPPMQKSATFNLDQVKADIQKQVANRMSQ
jgi:arylsulfatase